MARKKKHNTLNFHKYLGVILIIIALIALSLIYFIDLLPLDYFIVLSIVVGIIVLTLFRLLKDKNKFLKTMATLISILLIIFMVLGINYELNTLDFLKQFGFNAYKTENYNVLVLKNNNYKEITNLKNKTIGHIKKENREGLEKAIQKLSTKIEYKESILNSTHDLAESLLNKKLDAIILEENEFQILLEESILKNEEVEVLYNIEVEIEMKDISKEVDITRVPFTIYISGIDTYGKINKVSRSDVNMLMTVNPEEKKILLTSIPRDYYVNLSGINEYDKLTHVGIYGIETSLKTIENLLSISINYYVKVNFTSLIDIVEALGGITVDSAYTFTSMDNYTFTKGKNNLNGKEALSFSRERSAFMEGDRTRGENQQRVLIAIINKALSPTIITKYNDLLNSLKGKFITNIDDEKIKDFIKMQIENPRSWEINRISLNGTDAYDYTYSFKKNKLYVMKPSLESIESARAEIRRTLEN